MLPPFPLRRDLDCFVILTTAVTTAEDELCWRQQLRALRTRIHSVVSASDDSTFPVTVTCGSAFASWAASLLPAAAFPHTESS